MTAAKENGRLSKILILFGKKEFTDALIITAGLTMMTFVVAH